MDQKVLIDVLDAVSDDAYDIAELWSIARGVGVDEEDARRRTRETVLALEGRGYVQLLLETSQGTWTEPALDEVQKLRDDFTRWGIGSETRSLLRVIATP